MTSDGARSWGSHEPPPYVMASASGRLLSGRGSRREGTRPTRVCPGVGATPHRTAVRPQGGTGHPPRAGAASRTQGASPCTGDPVPQVRDRGLPSAFVRRTGRRPPRCDGHFQLGAPRDADAGSSRRAPSVRDRPPCRQTTGGEGLLRPGQGRQLLPGDKKVLKPTVATAAQLGAHEVAATARRGSHLSARLLLQSAGELEPHGREEQGQKRGQGSPWGCAHHQRQLAVPRAGWGARPGPRLASSRRPWTPRPRAPAQEPKGRTGPCPQTQ